MSELTLQQRNLFSALARLAQLRREALDMNMLQSVVAAHNGGDPAARLVAVARDLQISAPKPLRRADEVHCPLLMEDQDVWGIVMARKPDGTWVVLAFDPATGSLAEEARQDFSPSARFFRMALQQRFAAAQSPSLKLIAAEILAERRGLRDLVAGSLFIAVVALVTSIYSMQVYDRVIPTNATATLLVLTLGAMVAALLDSVAKWSRAQTVSDLSDRVDQRLARSIFARFLGLRLDVMPPSVGMMAQRMRSYESVRQFLVGFISTLAVDIPLAILLLAVMVAIGGYLALVPLTFLVIGTLAAFLIARQIEAISRSALPAHNQKMGHLVESIEGAEIIKSGNGGWRMLSKWLDLTDRARGLDHDMKQITEGFQFFVGFAQQIAYVGLIALGALYVATGAVTMGGLIACSILSGRIVSPLAGLANIIVQWANTKASLQDIDRFWQIAQDIPEDGVPLLVDAIKGDYHLQGVSVSYAGLPALVIEDLHIKSGESIAVLGTIGSGKTTLLRTLSGLYQPQSGQVRLDGLSISALDKATLAAHVAFVPQDGRLFAGSLRDNLLIGLTDPGDSDLIAAAKLSGLFEAVIAPHPKGLAREINEGGLGLSGGQRQLVHITRAMLRKPTVWLLDEPTASMDAQSEQRVIAGLQTMRDENPASVFVFVTHKPQIASLASRVIVLHAGKIALDGPRDEVFRRLQGLTSDAQASEEAGAAQRVTAAAKPDAQPAPLPHVPVEEYDE